MPTTQKIRYADCDPQGIVFNGHYPRYWDDALSDWFDDLTVDGLDLADFGVDVVAARLEMDFRRPAHQGDTLETAVAVERLGNTSMTVAFTTRRLSDDETVTEGREVVVFVDAETLRPVAVPDRFRSAVSPSGIVVTEEVLETS